MLVIVAGICGSIAQSIVGCTRGGCLISIVLGFIGAVLGTWIARQAGLPEILTVRLGNERFPIVWSVIGAAVFVAVLGLISGRSRQSP